MSDDTTLNARVDKWFAAPIEGHGLYARYQDARDLIAALRAEVERLRTERDAAAELSGQVQEWYTAYRRRAEARVAELLDLLELVEGRANRNALAANEKAARVAALTEARDGFRKMLRRLAVAMEAEQPHCWTPRNSIDLGGNLGEEACGVCDGCHTMTVLEDARALLAGGTET